MKLSPARYVIHAFGGVTALARAIKRDHSTVSRWQNSKDLKGTGGYIPMPAQRDILRVAKRLGIDITPDDLILGREISKEELTQR